MWQQFIEQLPQGVVLLKEGAGFYFSSAVLVLLSLIPTAGRIVGVASGRHIVKMTLNILLELIVLAGRVLLVAAILIVGDAMDSQEVTSIEGWVSAIQGASLYLWPEWAGVVAQLLVVAAGAMLVNKLFELFFTEQRTAKLLERMQHKATPHKVQMALLLSVKNLVIIPIFLVCVLMAVQLI